MLLFTQKQGKHMPTYEYKHIQTFIKPCTTEVVEVFHSMSAPNLTHCPYCNFPVAKQVSKLNKIKSERDALSDKNIASKGFTKYVKAGDGKYEKVAGPQDAPSTLDRNVMQANMAASGMDEE